MSSKKVLCYVRFEIHLVQSNIVSTKQNIWALKKYIFRTALECETRKYFWNFIALLNLYNGPTKLLQTDTFNQQVPRNSWCLFYQSQKNERPICISSLQISAYCLMSQSRILQFCKRKINFVSMTTWFESNSESFSSIEEKQTVSLSNWFESSHK